MLIRNKNSREPLLAGSLLSLFKTAAESGGQSNALENYLAAVFSRSNR